jgi:hypothetical protein
MPVSQEVNLSPEVEEEFRGARNASLKTAHPVIKAAMLALNSVWPQRLSMGELHAHTAERLGVSVESVPAGVLTEGVVAAYRMRVLGFHVYSPGAVARSGDRPQASALVRLQLRNGGVVTNLLHQTVKVEDDALRLLHLLDGQRDRKALAAELGLSEARIEDGLAQLARSALLES